MPASRKQGNLKRDVIKLWVLDKEPIPRISQRLNITIQQVENIISQSYYSIQMHDESHWRQVIQTIKEGHMDRYIFWNYPVSRSFIKEVRKLCECPA